jgi:orotidine-5'-phosphate decarboxylase
MTTSTDPRIIVALDYPDAAPALALAKRLEPGSCGLKIGKELFVAAGPDIMRTLVAHGHRVFLDLKFHDIPNTVAQACAAATRLGAWMMTVHASGGSAMLAAARSAVDATAKEIGAPPPKLIAVTVLTSLSALDLGDLGIADTPAGQAKRLARLAAANDLDGVVCSAIEAPTLRAATAPGFLLVTPGIRPAGSGADDQARVVTPEAAIANGADYLVIGRPITRANDPVAVLHALNASLAEHRGSPA